MKDKKDFYSTKLRSVSGSPIGVYSLLSTLLTAGVINVSVKDVQCALLAVINEHVEGGTDHILVQVIKRLTVQ